jgi:hypothetical protein
LAADIQNKKIKDKDSKLEKWVEKYGAIPVNFCEDPWTLQDVKNQLDVNY